MEEETLTVASAMYGMECLWCPVVYGVEGNATFLECVPRTAQAELRWAVQPSDGQQETRGSRELPQSDERSLHLKRGLLIQHLEPADAGLYICTGHEHSYSQVLARYRIHIIPNHNLHPARLPQHPAGRKAPAGAGMTGFLGQSGPAHPSLLGHRNSWQQLPLRSYKDLHMVEGNGLSVDEYCEQLWYREKRRQQKLRTLKLKHESRKARVRRNNPPEEVPL
ncbi:semaphorin-3D-like [Parambassis ranga]|uniref:Semaphorin-3D-like n=1 Tax=Parambassis ranga TaxID=210632 RepID=A0A6P7KE11_9TELE|nr:semaphorin-3D-like [Parambassis ranga]